MASTIVVDALVSSSFARITRTSASLHSIKFRLHGLHVRQRRHLSSATILGSRHVDVADTGARSSAGGSPAAVVADANANANANPDANKNAKTPHGSVSAGAGTNVDRIHRILNTYRRGYTLPRDFYVDAELHQMQMEKFWPQQWLFAGYENQIPVPGAYFVYNIGAYSIVVVRDTQQRVRAFHNVCRHRGARLVTQPAGKCAGNRFVCKYHCWSYSLDGRLIGAGEMQDNTNFDRNAWESGLLPVEVTTISGMIMVRPRASADMGRNNAPTNATDRVSSSSSASSATGIEAAKRLMEPQLGVYDLLTASHPEYVQSNYDTVFIYRNGVRIPAEAEKSRRAMEAVEVMRQQTSEWRALGLPFECTAHNSFGAAHNRNSSVKISKDTHAHAPAIGADGDDDGNSNGHGYGSAGAINIKDAWFRCSRQPLRRGWVSESLDGKQVCARLLGQAPQCNLGSLRIMFLPNFWLHCSGDHAVSTRLTPIDGFTTECKVDWLVHQDAVENRDYSLERMLPFWQRTSEQDWQLCEMHQQGVLSPVYESRPLSVRKETGLVHFHDWYVQALRHSLS